MNERLTELYRASRPKEALASQDEFKSANALLGSDVEKFAKKGSKLRWIPIDVENSNFWSLAMASEIKMGD